MAMDKDVRETARDLAGAAREHIMEPGYHRYVLLLLAVMLPAVYFTRHWVAFLLMVLTVAVSFISTRTGVNRLGVETATFSTVVMGVTFGPEKGAVLGVVYILLQLFSGKPPGMYMLWVVPAFGLAGHLAGSFPDTGIVRLGFSISLGLQSFFTLMTLVFMRRSVAKYLRYSVFNVIFNYVLFLAAGPAALSLLGV